MGPRPSEFKGLGGHRYIGLRFGRNRRTLPSITPKQARFVAEYLKDLNASQAAIRAGYTQHRADQAGYQLLRNTEIQRAIVEQRQTLEAESIADAKERREILSTIMRSAEAAPVDRTRAIDVANKMDGVYVEKHEHAVTIPGAIAFLITKAPHADCRD